MTPKNNTLNIWLCPKIFVYYICNKKLEYMSNQKWINSEYILKQISEIGNFKGSIDKLSGVLEWYDKDRDFTIFATPNWVTDGEVPFDIDRGSGLEIWNVCTIKMVDEDESTQFTHYLNVLMMIMNHYSEFTKPTENV